MGGSAPRNKSRKPYKITRKIQVRDLWADRQMERLQGLPRAGFAYILDSYFLCKNMPDI
jgi:hypothetical protein